MNITAGEQQNTVGERKWLRRVVFAILGLALIVAVPVTISKMMGRSALRTQLQRLHDAGEPLTFDELQARLPSLADADNSALVLDKLKEPLASLWENREQWSEVPFVGEAELPPWSEPWPIALQESISAFLHEHDSVLSRLDPIHLMPRGRLKLDLTINPWEYFFPTLSHVRTAAKLEALAALRDAAESKPEDALGRCTTMVHIGASLHDTPTLISALVSVAIEGLAVNTAERVLSCAESGHESLRALQESLDGDASYYGFVTGMRGERLFQVAIADYARQPKKTPPPGPQGLSFGAGPSASSWLLSGLTELNIAKSLELLSDFIEAGDSPHAAITAAKEFDLATQALPAYYYVSRITLPSYSRSCELTGNHVAAVRCARTALAAERFRLDRGRWPAQLADLVPEYIDAVPLDPFDGQPLRYKVDADRIVVYSIGLNTVDDGGDLAEPPGIINRPPDIGFRLLNPDLRGFKTIDRSNTFSDDPQGSAP